MIIFLSFSVSLSRDNEPGVGKNVAPQSLCTCKNTPTFEQLNQISEQFDQIPPEIILKISVSEISYIMQIKE